MVRLGALSVVFCLCLTGEAIAAPKATPATVTVGSRRFQLLPDDAKGAVTLIIDGKPVLQVTSSTIRVNQDLTSPPRLQAADKTGPCERGR